MANTPEGVVKKAVRDLLDQQTGMHYDMPVPTGYGRTTLDFIGCHKGRYFGIETKADRSKRPTPRQEVTINSIIDAGGKVFVICGKDDLSLYLLKMWLDQEEPQSDDYFRFPKPPRARRPI